MKKTLLIALASLLVWSCQTHYQVQQISSTQHKVISDSIAKDAKAAAIIAPYKVRLDSLMNVQLITADGDFKKAEPEGSLGNMVCDLLMTYARKKGHSPDLCIMNNGGLRIPVIYKGEVTVRTIYELMPFENQLILLRIQGAKMEQLMKGLAASGGAPVSGIQMEISGNTYSSLLVQGKPFDNKKEYWVLTSDYLANGGDKADALKDPLEVIDLNRLIRDVLIETLDEMDTQGAHLIPVNDGRITEK